MAPIQPLKLFISYRSLDSVKVDPLVARLQSFKTVDGTPHYEVWQDKFGILPGKDWWEAIVDAIIACDVFIFMVSSESVGNVNCRAELNYAHRRNRPILPLILDGEYSRNPVTGKNDIGYWEHIPEDLTEGRLQFLFYDDETLDQQLTMALAGITPESSRRQDIRIARPPDPRLATESNSDSIALYGQACDFALRGELDVAERMFRRLMNASDSGFNQEARAWVEILVEYAELLRLNANETTRFRLETAWPLYAKQFPRTFVAFFDPKGIRDSLRKTPTAAARSNTRSTLPIVIGVVVTVLLLVAIGGIGSGLFNPSATKGSGSLVALVPTDSPDITPTPTSNQITLGTTLTLQTVAAIANQSATAMIGQSATAITNQSATAMIDQSATVIANQSAITQSATVSRITPTRTFTPLPPTTTPGASATPISPTKTWTPSATPIPPSATNTTTPIAPPTLVPPTAKPSNTPTNALVVPVADVIQPGLERTDSFGIKQVYVPAGCFMMGSDPSKDQSARINEQPQHQVCVSKGYWLDEFDVTNATFDLFVKAKGYSTSSFWSDDGWIWKQANKGTVPGNKDSSNNDCTKYSNMPNQPRVCVSYYEAEAYANWRTCRLPTETEWEYAARGTDDRIYPWGNAFDQSKVNSSESNIGETTAVDAYPAGKSWVGAYDMAGNVWQWVSDWFDANAYSSDIKTDPTGPTTGQTRILRGGSWSNDQFNARAAYRNINFPAHRDYNTSFRLVCSAATSGDSQATAPAVAIVPTNTANVVATAVPTTSANTIAAGTERTDSFGIKQVYVPAGCFMMGSDPSKDQSAKADEQPQHQVCISKGYWLDEFDVTNATFDAFAKAGGYTNDSLWSTNGLSWKQSNRVTGPSSKDDASNDCTKYSSQQNQPRVCVNYYEAEAYAKWRGGRLPTESEWEYAAHGTDGRIYPWGGGFEKSKANTQEGGLGKTSAVNAYPASRSWVGAYDMAGNVSQWVGDWYGNYTADPTNDPKGPNSGQYRVIRGGSFYDYQRDARSANRGGTYANYHGFQVGFRVVSAAAG